MLAAISNLSKYSAFFGATNGKDKVVCDQVNGLNFTFEPERYVGSWYEIYHHKD